MRVDLKNVVFDSRLRLVGPVHGALLGRRGAQVDDDRAVLLPDELPEVAHRLRQRALCGDVHRLTGVVIVLQ